MSDTIQTKRCSHCKQIKPISGFSKDKTTKDSFSYMCKFCQSLRYKQYYQTHRMQKLQTSKQWHQKHRDDLQKYNKEYHQKHKEEILKRKKRYQEEHQERYQQYQKRYSKKRRNTIWGHLMDIWHQMLRRCNNPKSSGWKYYGGRGIRVKFACFDDFFDYVKELKTNPRGLTIDRIDNNGHYEPGNIRFVTHRENCQNRRHI